MIEQEQVIVRDPQGKNLIVEVPSNGTVGDLKNAIHQSFGVQPSD